MTDAPKNRLRLMGETFPFDGVRPLTLHQAAIHEACHVVIAELFGIRAYGVAIREDHFPEFTTWNGSTFWRDKVDQTVRATIPIHLAPEAHPQSGGLGDGDVGHILSSPFWKSDLLHARHFVRSATAKVLADIEALAAVLEAGEASPRMTNFIYDWCRDYEPPALNLILRDAEGWKPLYNGTLRVLKSSDFADRLAE